MATTQQKAGAGGAAAVLAALLALLIGTQQGASPPTTTTARTTPTTGTTTTGVPSTTSPAPDTVRWFADDASWNRPAAELGRAPDRYQTFARRLWDHAGGADRPGRIRTAFVEYSVPTYDASTATTKARVFQTGWSEALFPFGVPRGTVIPWSPKWSAGTGNDNILLVVDRERAWKVAGVGQAALNCIQPANLIEAGKPRPRGVTIDLCVSDVRATTNLPSGTDSDQTNDRGMGIAKAALLTRAVEVRSGAITHALALSITGTMFGAPTCSPANRAPPDVDSCGWFVPPATKLERATPNIASCHAGQTFTPADRARTIPEGMRFALDISDADITRWLDSRRYSGPLRETARIFAVAMRDYGWIIAETACFGTHIETDGIVGPAAPLWAELGIRADGTKWPHVDFLDGLATPERIYVVNSPDEFAFAS